MRCVPRGSPTSGAPPRDLSCGRKVILLATSCRICSFWGETIPASPLRTAEGRGLGAPHIRARVRSHAPLTTREPTERKEDQAFDHIPICPLRGEYDASAACSCCRRHARECPCWLCPGQPLDRRDPSSRRFGRPRARQRG